MLGFMYAYKFNLTLLINILVLYISSYVICVFLFYLQKIKIKQNWKEHDVMFYLVFNEYLCCLQVNFKFLWDCWQYTT